MVYVGSPGQDQMVGMPQYCVADGLPAEQLQMQLQPLQQDSYTGKGLVPMAPTPLAQTGGAASGDTYLVMVAVPVSPQGFTGQGASGAGAYAYAGQPGQQGPYVTGVAGPEMQQGCWPAEAACYGMAPAPVFPCQEQAFPCQEQAFGRWPSEGSQPGATAEQWAASRWTSEGDGCGSDNGEQGAHGQEAQWGSHQEDTHWGSRRGTGSAQRRRRKQRDSQPQLATHQERRYRSVARPMASAEAGFVAKLTAGLESGGEALTAAVDMLRRPGLVHRLSFEPMGCRAVQLALDVAGRRAAAEIAGDLKGCVAEAIKSPYANYVLQKMIKVLSPQEISFLVEEVSAAGLDLVRHEYGCRIYCRLLEHSATEPNTARLMDKALAESEDLVRHTFGHHVVECALEHGMPQQRQTICRSLRRDLMRNARNRNAAYVIEKALLYGSLEDRRALAADILAHPVGEVAALARSQFGSMVVRALLRLPEEITHQVQEHLKNTSFHVKAAKHNRRGPDDLKSGIHAGAQTAPSAGPMAGAMGGT